ncbi:MAG: glycosyltransferase [Muricomes sp.]
MCRSLLAWEPDIIHTQCEFSTFLIARRIAKSLSIPIIHTYHTVYEDYTHYFLSNKKWGRHMAASLSRWVIEQCSGVIAPTEKVRMILNSYGIEQNIHVIPTGINLDRFTKEPGAKNQLAVKKRLGIPDGNHILLYVGRLAKEKNLEELLQYYAKQNTENLTFLIVGDGPYRGELEQMASELGIRDSVYFAGMISPEQIGDYYHMGDIFVSASVSETQGLTYLEALASGVPALCRKDACLDGVIIDGYNGWQYEKEQDYMENMEFFFGNEVMQKTIRKNAAAFAQRMFSSAVFAEKAEHIYLEVLGELKVEKSSNCFGEMPCHSTLHY